MKLINRRRSWLSAIGCVIAAIFVSNTAYSQKASDLYIVNKVPASVFIYNLQLKVFTANIAIDKNPTMAVIEPQGKLLYVLHNGLPQMNPGDTKYKSPRWPSSLSVIDVKTRTLLRKIPLGWNVDNLVFANDSILVIPGIGKPRIGAPKSKAEGGFITVINARTGNVVFSTVRWRWIQQIRWTSDFTRIIVLGVNQFRKSKAGILYIPHIQVLLNARVRPYQHVVSILNAKGDVINEILQPVWKKPQLEFISLRGAFSEDQNWFYLFDPGEECKKTFDCHNAGILVVDLKTGKLVKSHDIGAPYGLMLRNPYNGNITVFANISPTNNQFRIFRLNGSEINTQGSSPIYPLYFITNKEPGGIYAFGYRKLTFIPDFIDTTQQMLTLEFQKSDIDKTIRALALPEKKRIVLFSSGLKFGILNTSKNQLESVGIIGREGVRTAKYITDFFSTVLFTPLIWIPIDIFTTDLYDYSKWISARTTLSNMAVRPDEEFVYVYEPISSDVTIIDISNGSVVDYIPVGTECKGISLTPDGRYLYAFGSNRLTVINTNTNKVHFKYAFEPDLGILKTFVFLNSSGDIAILYENSLQIWNTEKGSIIKTSRGLSNAKLLVCPQQQ